MLAVLPDHFTRPGVSRPEASEAILPTGPEPAPPAAVVLVLSRGGEARKLTAILDSLGRSRGAGHLPAASGSLAVMILAEDPAALAAAEDRAPALPFPLRVMAGARDVAAGIGQASEWAAALGAEGAPLLIATSGQPLAPRWAYDRLAALRDGADVVVPRMGVMELLLGRSRMPEALSARAQAVMTHWAAGRPAAAWLRRDAPWRRPGRAGLRAMTR